MFNVGNINKQHKNYAACCLYTFFKILMKKMKKVSCFSLVCYYICSRLKSKTK